ncbi:MAG: pyruvate kinase, partial [Acidobacteriota bacterium]
LGPASGSCEMIRNLIKAGMDVARLNFSHGEHEGHREVIQKVRAISRELDHPVAIIQDLQGVKIRTRNLKGGKPVELKSGEEFTLTTRKLQGDHRCVSTNYSALPQDVQAGDRILLSDGLIELKVLSTSSDEVRCTVVSGGMLGEKKGINVPGANLSAASLTKKDKEDVLFGIENGVDYIALSFVRRKEDILALQSILEEAEADIPVIAKMENPVAIENLEAILEISEGGVMIARGDLGVEVPPERVPVLQKRIIRKANKMGKPVITATQMLESMIHSPRPTRAEASDVANAIFDGTDAVMLSGETAVGDYPVESVSIMCRIIEEAEAALANFVPREDSEPHTSFADAVCEAAYHASEVLKTRAICAFTQTGFTARTISKYRPQTEIFGLSPERRIMRRMCLYWGVRPMMMHAIVNVDELIEMLERTLVDRGLVQTGDDLIILTGAPIIEKGHTSLMKLQRVQASPSKQMKMI